MLIKEHKISEFWFLPNTDNSEFITCHISYGLFASEGDLKNINQILLKYRRYIDQIQIDNNPIKAPEILNIVPVKCININFNYQLLLEVIVEISLSLQETGLTERYYNPRSPIFYKSYAENILSVHSHPEHIRGYLKEEKKFFLSKLIENGNYTAIFEVGCADSRNADLAEQCGINYYGIDFIPHLIEHARIKLEQFHEIPFHKVECMSMLELTSESSFILPHENALCIFPFNVVGNMGNFPYVLYKLQKLKLDFIVSTYQTNQQSKQVREEYYKNSGCTEVRSIDNAYINTFVSREGLKSSAYSYEYFNGIVNVSHYNMLTQELGLVGKGYYFKLIKSDRKLYGNTRSYNTEYAIS